MNAPTLDHVTDTVQDVAHKVADRAPDLASHVGRSARSTAETVAETVSDAVLKLAHKTPFLEAPKPQRNNARWMFRAAIVATIAGLAMWIVNRRRGTHPWYEVDETAAPEKTATTTERRFATAGH
jgi:ABC-type transporter Mla subunit MlaD